MADVNTTPQGHEPNGEAAGRPASATPRDKDALGAPGEPRPRAKRRRKVSYLTANKIDVVDYKDIAILRRFINDRGKILPARQTGNTAKQQRMIARCIRKAREMALLPFVVTEAGPERPRERGGYRDRGDRGDYRGDRDRDRDRDRSYERREPAAEAAAPAPAAAPAAESGAE
jgi:small subunit ribosomal protein S18